MSGQCRDTRFYYFFLNKVGEGPVNSALCLMHSESMCMNSAFTIHMRWKKEKEKRRKREIKSVDAQ